MSDLSDSEGSPEDKASVPAPPSSIPADPDQPPSTTVPSNTDELPILEATTDRAQGPSDVAAEPSECCHPSGPRWCPREYEDEAVYCDVCEMWLNGPEQWAGHIRSNKHRSKGRAPKGQ